MSLIQCPNCKRDNVSSVEKCSYCGFEIAGKNLKDLTTISCPKCKTEIISTSKRCWNCGYDFTKQSVPYETEHWEEDMLKRRETVKTIRITAVALLVLVFLIEILHTSSKHQPTTKLGAILPGIIFSALFLTAIILFVIAWVINRK